MEEWADGLRHIRNTIYKIRLRFCWKATAIIVNRWDTPAFCHRAEEGRSLHCHLRIKVGSPRHTTSGVYTDYILLYGSHKAFQVCGSREIAFWFETTWQFGLCFHRVFQVQLHPLYVNMTTSDLKTLERASLLTPGHVFGITGIRVSTGETMDYLSLLDDSLICSSSQSPAFECARNKTVSSIDF